MKSASCFLIWALACWIGAWAAVSAPTVLAATPSSSGAVVVQVTVGGTGFVASGAYPAGTLAASGHGYLFSATAATWDGAEAACEAQGGTLATITSAGEDATVASTWTANAYDGFWIGMNDVASPGAWAWVTGETATFFDWAPSEPNNPSIEHHVQVYMAYGLDGQWNNLSGAQLRPYVCEFHGAGPVAPTVRLVGSTIIASTNAVFLDAGRVRCAFDLSTAAAGSYDVSVTNADGGAATLLGGFTVVGARVPPPTVTAITPSSSSPAAIDVTVSGTGFFAAGGYPAGTVSSNGHGYLFSATAATWDGAEAACEAQGGTLATITSAGENTTVASTWSANSYDGFWIGMNDLAVARTWAWVTGEAATYFDWAPSEPNDPSIEHHVQVYMAFGLNGQWNNLSGSQVRPYVCEFHGAGQTPPSVLLVGPRSIAPTTAVFLDADHVRCRFDLSGATAGAYDVTVANPDGQTAMLAGGFVVATTTTRPVVQPTAADGAHHRLRFGGTGGPARCGAGMATAAAAVLVMLARRLRGWPRSLVSGATPVRRRWPLPSHRDGS